MKKCVECNKEKKFDLFERNRNKCKSCRAEERLHIMRTKEGVIKRIYRTQITSSKKRGHIPPEYSLDELKNFMLNSDKFHEIYNVWENNGFDKYDKPSIDRVDDSIGYSLDNISIMSWADNKRKSHRDSMTEKLSTGRRKSPVRQLSKDGIFINEFISVREASRQTDTHAGDISACCNGKNKTAGGYIWEKVC